MNWMHLANNLLCPPEENLKIVTKKYNLLSYRYNSLIKSGINEYYYWRNLASGAAEHKVTMFSTKTLIRKIRNRFWTSVLPIFGYYSPFYYLIELKTSRKKFLMLTNTFYFKLMRCHIFIYFYTWYALDLWTVMFCSQLPGYLFGLWRSSR